VHRLLICKKGNVLCALNELELAVIPGADASESLDILAMRMWATWAYLHQRTQSARRVLISGACVKAH